MTNTFRLCLLFLAFGANPVTAEAREPHTDRIVVFTADLDLRSDRGQRLLNRRINRAVTEVCGTASDVDLAGGNQVRRCLRLTRDFVAKKRDQRVAAASARPIQLAGR